MNNTLTGLFDVICDYYIHLNLKCAMLEGQKCIFSNIPRLITFSDTSTWQTMRISRHLNSNSAWRNPRMQFLNELLTVHENNIWKKSRLRLYYNVNSIAASEFFEILKNPHRKLVIIGLSPTPRFLFEFRYYEFW